MRTSIALAIVLACLLPAGASASLGKTTTGTFADNPGDATDGSGQVWRIPASTSETVNRLSVYLTGGTATNAHAGIGIYSGNTRLQTCTITTITKNAWNRCAIPNTALTAGTTYGLALLRPLAWGVVEFSNASGTYSSWASSSSSLAALPATWANGASYGGQGPSIYADNSGGGGGDTTPPDTIIDSGPTNTSGGYTNVVNQTFTFHATEPSTFQCKLDSGLWSACTSPKTYTGLADGNHTFFVVATDTAGNVDPSSAFRGWTLDTVAPTTPANLAASPGNGQVSLTWGSSTDAQCLTGYNVYRNGVLVATTPQTSYTDTGLTNGTLYSYTVKALDCAGNTSAASNTATATPGSTADTTPPDTIIDSGPTNTSGGYTNQANQTFTFHATEPSTFQCKLDAGNWVACTSPVTYGPLADGNHSFFVVATDTAGNVDPSSAFAGWTQDTVPPTTPSNLAATPGNGQVSLTWGASTDAVCLTGYRVFRNGTAVATTPQTSYTDTGLTNGTTYNYTVKAVDCAGNLSAVSGTVPATPTGGGGAEPGPIAGQGYHQVFRDDFTTLNRSVWDDHIWYDDPPSAAWTGFQQVDSSGILHLRTSRSFSCGSGCNYPINTITTQSSGLRYQYGYFEARMKWPGGHGSWPGFWLYSYQHAIDSSQCTTQAGEIDVMEAQGSEPMNWYGTVHSNTNGCSPSDQQNGNNFQETSTDLTAGFHTYAVKWTPSTVTWYLDGVATHSASTYSTDNQPMFVLLQEWVGGWTFDPDATTPDTLDNQIDYVTIWQQ